MRGCKQKQVHYKSYNKVILHYYCVCFNCTSLCRVGNSEHRPLSNVTTLYHNECALCSTAWSQWFGELEDCLLGYCRQGLDTWKTAARFGYVKDCCKVWIHERLLQGLDTWKDCCKVIWIRERLLQGSDTWKTAALGIEAWSTPSVGPHWKQIDECTHQ